MGCNDLVVVVDHQPLTSILGDKTLDKIPNARLFRLKQRTLPWVYEIYWLPGIDNCFSDTASRHPVSSEDMEINSYALLMSAIMVSPEDLAEEIAMVHIKSDLNKVSAVTWERLQEATFAEYSDTYRNRQVMAVFNQMCNQYMLLQYDLAPLPSQFHQRCRITHCPRLKAFADPRGSESRSLSMIQTQVLMWQEIRMEEINKVNL